MPCFRNSYTGASSFQIDHESLHRRQRVTVETEILEVKTGKNKSQEVIKQEVMSVQFIAEVTLNVESILTTKSLMMLLLTGPKRGSR